MVPGGQIYALDSSDYGPVNIDKPVTIDGGNTLSSIGTEKRLASCAEVSAICVATSGTVILRNLKIEYVPAHPESFSPAISLRGDRKLDTAPMVVHLEKMVVRTPGNVCIYSDFSVSSDRISGPASGDRVSVSDTELLECMSGAWIQTNATFDNVRIHGPGRATDSVGISSFGRSVSIRNVTVSDASFGFIAGDRADVTIENSLSFNNGVGIKVDFAGKVRLINTTVHLNKLGLEVIDGGTIVSWGNNHISGNDTNGEPTSTTSQK